VRIVIQTNEVIARGGRYVHVSHGRLARREELEVTGAEEFEDALVEGVIGQTCTNKSESMMIDTMHMPNIG